MKAKTTQLAMLLISIVLLCSSTTSPWKILHEKDGIKIFHQKVKQIDQKSKIESQYALFKWQNTTDKKVTVNFRLDLYFNGHCRACNLPSPNEYEMSVTLNPNQSIEGNMQHSEKKYKVLLYQIKNSKHQNVTYKFSNIKITH